MIIPTGSKLSIVSTPLSFFYCETIKLNLHMVKCTDLKNDVHLVTTTPNKQPSSNKHDSRKFSLNQSLSPQATIAQISITTNSSVFELLTDGIIQCIVYVSNFFHSMFLLCISLHLSVVLFFTLTAHSYSIAVSFTCQFLWHLAYLPRIAGLSRVSYTLLVLSKHQSSGQIHMPPQNHRQNYIHIHPL